MKNTLLNILAMLLAVGFISANAKAAVTQTIATFNNPSNVSSDWLFKVDFNNSLLTGGWDDDKTGLTLEIPYSNHTIANGTAFTDAWFNMTDVEITSGTMPGEGFYGLTGPGTINFYANGTSTNPLLVIEFTSGFVSRYSSATNKFAAADVTFTGSEIIGTLSDEQFAFSFADKIKLPGPHSFTAAASFTSATPEPATVALLGIGALSMLCRKRSKA